jgi:dnaX_nterm: DNA polymerase III, subunit gamma and tau
MSWNNQWKCHECYWNRCGIQ